jgi:signal transduction histidine kinase
VKKRFITAISFFFILAFAVLSYLQFHYFEVERLRLIDQQIDRTVSELASTPLSKEVLSSQQKTEGLIFDTLDEDPPNQAILLRGLDDKILYRNELAESLGLDLPPRGSRASVTVDGHKIRYMTYRPASQPAVIQVGLVLDQREISWSHAIWRILFFSALVTVLFILLAAWLTGYLLRPIVELARFFRHSALEPEDIPPPAIVNSSREFRFLSDTIRQVSGRWRNSLAEHSSLMARMVHEIRTPLTVIRNRLEGLDGAKVKEALSELEHIEALTAEFASWAKIEYSLPSDPGLHAIPAAAFIGDLACVKSGQARVEIRAQAGTKLFAKPEHLRVVLENLLNNAQKHGRPPVHLTLEDGWFEVGSCGAPIPDAVKENMGKPFNRGEGSSGSGLGLANIFSICRKYGWKFEYRYEGGENIFRVSWE